MTASPLWITFALYLAGMLGIGFYAWWRTRSFDDYILGGRSLNPWVTALSTGASDMSGWLLMGLPGALYASGLAESWIAIGLVAGAWANWRYVAGPLRVYTERAGNALTLPDYFTHRFEDRQRLLRVLCALVILVFFAIYSASGIVAGARLFESTFGLPYAQALWAGAAVTIAYTLLGGFLAVSWTDTVQASLMIFALILVPLIVIAGSGGPLDAHAMIAAAHPVRADWFAGTSLVGIVSLLAWGLGYVGQPHILARFMAAESLVAIRPARRIGMSWMVICLAGAIAVGYYANAWYAAHPELAGAVNENPERVFILLAQQLFHPWVAGVLLSAVLAAIMSTLSCQLLVCSSALTEDFYKAFLRPAAGQRELIWVGRATLLAVALVAVWLAWSPDNSVLKLVSYAWAGFGAAFGPVVVISLYWRGMTRDGALAGVLVGAITVLVWKRYAWFGLYEMVPGVLFASLAIWQVSRAGSVPATVAAGFDRVHGELRATS
ncbi:MAG: sodium/proline symporter PutP [Xanthomonadales bacterium]|nr:Sodium/proline symporter [Xanthomonadales bacterium]MCC6593952.1 sodium/proline symporter PutP [Xanthomonadales bacterium]MCE7932341.1 sodium/proline symporter PutP [Xanthomonadales bacterium PRO6]